MLTANFLRESIEKAFAIGIDAGATGFGLEVEAIPVDRITAKPISLVKTAAALRSLNWIEHQSAKSGAPEFHRAHGARLTFEPGGQTEYSSATHSNGTSLLSEIDAALSAVDFALGAANGHLSYTGLDPLTPVSDVPLQLSGERYQRMDRYFESIAPAGRRMMRQTASIQFCIGAGEHPLQRWRLLSALAPIVAAMFANSPFDTGIDSGESSRRRRIWAELDPQRTGLRALGGDPVSEYLEFALDAPAFLLGPEPEQAEPFRNWIGRGATSADWDAHLSTLFPDVRARGYFELRVADAVRGNALAAIVALVGGVLLHPDADRLAKLLPAPTATLMAAAGMSGLSDSTLRESAVRAIAFSREGGRAAGAALLDDAGWERAGRFFAEYTLCGRTPADDVRTLTAA